METSLSSTINGSGVIAVPSGYIDLKNARISREPVQVLTRKTPDWIYLNYPNRTSYGIPKNIARDGSNFIFGPAPDSQYLVAGMYYARPAALSSALNDIFTDNPELFLFAALAEAEPWLKNDDRIPVWEKKFGQILADVQMEDDRESGSGSGLAVTVA